MDSTAVHLLVWPSHSTCSATLAYAGTSEPAHTAATGDASARFSSRMHCCGTERMTSPSAKERVATAPRRPGSTSSATTPPTLAPRSLSQLRSVSQEPLGSAVAGLGGALRLAKPAGFLAPLAVPLFFFEGTFRTTTWCRLQRG